MKKETDVNAEDAPRQMESDLNSLRVKVAELERQTNAMRKAHADFFKSLMEVDSDAEVELGFALALSELKTHRAFNVSEASRLAAGSVQEPSQGNTPPGNTKDLG